MNEKDVAYLQERGDLTTIVPVYQLAAKWIQFEDKDKKYIGSVDYYDVTVLNEAKAGVLPRQMTAENFPCSGHSF